MFYLGKAGRTAISWIKHVASITTSWSLLTGLVVIFLVFDGVITNLPSYSLSSHQSISTHILFGIEVSICIISQVTYLKVVKTRFSTNPPVGNFRKYANITHTVVSITQYTIVTFLIVIFLEIEGRNQYHTVLIQISVLLSTCLSVGLSGLLAYRFLRWIKYREDYLIIAYTAAAILICVNSLFVALFMSSEMQVRPPIIDPSFFYTDITIANYSLHQVQSNISFASFLSLWIASSILLRNYKRKWRALKFYLIIFIPLVYYLGAVQFALSGALVYYHLLSTFDSYTVNVINSILTRPSGGILFGVTFWIVSRSISEKKISDYMKLCAIGIMLLSISNQDAGLYLLPYPPFGLPTITFVGISSYLLLVGIYYTSISISMNAELRRSIEDSVERQYRFVSRIGTTQMENELESRVKGITKRSAKLLEESTGVEAPLENEDIEEYIKVIIKEKEKILRENIGVTKKKDNENNDSILE